MAIASSSAFRAIAQYTIEPQGLPALMPDSIQQEARQILDTLAFTPFEQCQSLSREFGLKVAPLLPAATLELKPFQDKDFNQKFQMI